MKYSLLLLLSLLIISCEKYDTDVLPLVGVYEANVVGVGGPFSISISADRGNRVLIDAPWDGENWSVIEAQISNEYEYEKDINIRNQRLDGDVRIFGDGIFFDYSIQLDYAIEMDGETIDFTLVGTKI